MPRKPRKLRAEINRIPSNVTAEYLGGLCADSFLEENRPRGTPSNLTPEEHELVREYEKCNQDFEKWKKFKNRKK